MKRDPCRILGTQLMQRDFLLDFGDTMLDADRSQALINTTRGLHMKYVASFCIHGELYFGVFKRAVRQVAISNCRLLPKN
ncbi:MAG: hypothetical protein PF495_18435 [Spirochaetales bacterium]|jgi:hypothetical protein|nr:hypothetical protein [Spirochaetales bacterium]